jgi:hypothetical protein
MAKPKNKSSGHGGRRPGAGRPTLGTQAMLIRIMPKTSKRLKSLAKKLGKTPGQWLDECLAAAGSGIIAHKLAIVRSEIQDRRRFCRKTAADLKMAEPDRAAQFESAADGLGEALKMVEEQLDL